jgi:hypothetical protein
MGSIRAEVGFDPEKNGFVPYSERLRAGAIDDDFFSKPLA